MPLASCQRCCRRRPATGAERRRRRASLPPAASPARARVQLITPSLSSSSHAAGGQRAAKGLARVGRTLVQTRHSRLSRLTSRAAIIQRAMVQAQPWLLRRSALGLFLACGHLQGGCLDWNQCPQKTPLLCDDAGLSAVCSMGWDARLVTLPGTHPQSPTALRECVQDAPGDRRNAGSVGACRRPAPPRRPCRRRCLERHFGLWR